ncbi:MAG: AMP-binding protein [Acidimicrobiia bacterium]
MGAYDDIYTRSIEDPEGFWGEAAELIDWFEPPTAVLTTIDEHHHRWFEGGVMNTCYNALDRHVLGGRGEQAAVIYDSPVTGRTQTITYAQLLEDVSRFAGALAARGVGRGDTVIVYLPMVPEAVVAMLACARLGAVHSVVFGGFAPNELAIRIDDARPKVIVSTNAGIEVQRVIEYKPLLDEAIRLASHQPDTVMMFHRDVATIGGTVLPVASMIDGRDVDARAAMAAAEPVGCTPVDAWDPLYVLYTSGTTGKPKGVVRDNGGHAVALAWSMPNIYDTRPGQVFWAASDVGWVVGHSYIVYAPLFTGCTTVLYEGKPVGTPDPGAFWRVVSEHRVRTLFTAPTAFRAIKKEDPSGALIGQYDLSDFVYLFLAGERLDPDTYHWASEHLDRPVIDHWWQTETGWPIAANCVGIEQLPVKPGSPTRPAPGYRVRILDAGSGDQVPANTEGSVAIELPLPPGCLPTLWNDDARFVSSYLSTFPGHYTTGDGGYLDDDGYLFVMGRIDDVINVAGHRLSTGAMEEVLATHPDVAECAVIGVADELKGQLPVGFVVLKAGVDRTQDDLQPELVALVRQRIGAVAALRTVLVVQRLPKTRSGKVLRATMRSIADGREFQVPSTIDDPAILDEIGHALESARTPGTGSIPPG